MSEPTRSEDMPMPFTVANWATVQSIPNELRAIRDILSDSVMASKLETAAIHAAIRASDARCDAQLKLANERIDEAHARMHALDKRFVRWTVRWSAYAAGVSGAAVVGWAFVKFAFNRG